MNRMRFIPALLLSLGMGACDTAQQPLAPEAARASLVDQQPATLSIGLAQQTYWTTHNGLRQFLTITGPQGTTRIEADYDMSGRLEALRTYYNDVLVGSDRTTWNGGALRRHMVLTADGDWVELDQDLEMIAYGDRDGGWYPCGVGEGDEVGVLNQHSCTREFLNYGKQSLGLLGGLMLWGAATTATGGLGGVWGAGILAAYQGHNWYQSMRDLDNCVKAGRQGPPDQII